MKTENQIIGELILLEKYKFVDLKLLAEIVHDTVKARKEGGENGR
jgi:hypothetical protein